MPPGASIRPWCGRSVVQNHQQMDEPDGSVAAVANPNSTTAEEFKRLSAQCVEIVRSKDRDTIEHELFLHANGIQCVVHARYRDSAPGLEHMETISSLREQLAAICMISGDVCGVPSPELRAALESAGVPIYTPLAAE